jgi:hypothetical protein
MAVDIDWYNLFSFLAVCECKKKESEKIIKRSKGKQNQGKP